MEVEEPQPHVHVVLVEELVQVERVRIGARVPRARQEVLGEPLDSIARPRRATYLAHMSESFLDRDRAAAEIVEAARRLYRLRLIVACQGNLSARIGFDRLLTTPAGACKGYLEPVDLVEVRLDGVSNGSSAPSSELPMHLAIYETRPDAVAVACGTDVFDALYKIEMVDYLARIAIIQEQMQK